MSIANENAPQNPENSSNHEKMDAEDKELQFSNAPNWLTTARIVLVPVVIYLMYQGSYAYDVAAALVFAAASITDYFDGYLARREQLVTIYGKLLDPLADKFLVVCSLVGLQQLGRVSSIVVMLLICREMAITSLRAMASAEGLIIAASNSAKWKTATQMVSIPFLMAQTLWGIPLGTIGMVLMYISLFISLWSGKDYVFDFFKHLKEKTRLKKIEKLSRKEAQKSSV